MSKFLQILAFMYHLVEKNPIYFDKAQMAHVLLEMLVKILKISFNINKKYNIFTFHSTSI